MTRNDVEGHLSEESSRVPGWLILDPDRVPDVWKDRVQEVALVPLLPSETEQLLDEGRAQPAVAAQDPEFLRRAARGDSAGEIARALSISTRSVHRRLARLRDSFGVRSGAELAAELSRRGF